MTTATREFSLVHAPVLSFFSGALYRDVLRRWPGTGVGYLLFLVALLAVPEALRVQREFARVAAQAPAVVKDMPQVRIRGGKVEVDAPQPYQLRNPADGHLLAIIDTTGGTDSLAGSDAGVLVTRDRLLVRMPDGNVQIHDLSGVSELTLDGPTVMGMMDALRALSLPVAYVAGVVVMMMVHGIKALVMALMVLMLARRMKTGVDARQATRLAAVALTPAMVAETLLEGVGAGSPAWSLFAAFASVGYLFFGLQANEEKDEPDTPDDDED